MRLFLSKILVVACSLVVLFSGETICSAERRTALVVGNGAYESAPLANPANDAADMAEALEKCGFAVMKHINVSRKQMRAAIREFGEEINRGAVGLFYFAGHGIQVDGENYMVPVGAEVHSEAEVEDECLRVSSVLRQMESAGNRLNIVILDACRNNPFGRRFRSGQVGLSKMDAPTGSILAYATAPGSVAADGTDRNGLYTAMLLKHLNTPGLEIGRLFRKVRIDVVNASGKRQTPWESSSLMGDFYFQSEDRKPVEKSAGNGSGAPVRIRASHILIGLSPTADEKATAAAMEKILDIRRRLENGEDFSALAKKYSEGPSAPKGGDLGYFGRGAMVKPFEDEAFALETGEVGGVVRTRFGLHLIKVTDRTF